MKKGVLWTVMLGILMVALAAGPDLWAAPGQSPARQTVPTRTPQPPPTEPPPPPPADQPTPVPSATAEDTSAKGPSELLLPDAGGWSIRLYLGAAMIVAALLVLVVVRR